MEKEHSELQQHIGRTDWWCENLGHWRAAITTAEVTAAAVGMEHILSEKYTPKPWNHLGTNWGEARWTRPPWLHVTQ